MDYYIIALLNVCDPNGDGLMYSLKENEGCFLVKNLC